MLLVNANSNALPSSDPQKEFEQQPRNRGMLEHLGGKVDSYITAAARTVNRKILGGTQIGESVKNFVAAKYQTTDEMDRYLIEKIRALDSEVKALFKQLDIVSKENFEEQIRNMEPGKKADACVEVLEKLLKFLDEIGMSPEISTTHENSSVDPSVLESENDCPAHHVASSSILSNGSDLSSNSASSSSSSIVNESERIGEDPTIKARIEELRILFDILHAVCFNDFSKIEEKHWTKLEELLAPESPPQPIANSAEDLKPSDNKPLPLYSTYDR